MGKPLKRPCADRIISCDQGSADWYRARLGRPTASCFDKIITSRGEPSRSAMTYMYRLLAERLLKESMDDQIGRVEWAERGREQEPHAMAHYEYTHRCELEQVGFVLSADGRYGCSPDRLIAGRNEAVECKAPAPWTHLRYLMEGPGADYRVQVQGQLLVGGFDSVTFFSFHACMPSFELVALPDKKFQAHLRAALNVFCDSLDRMEERARELGAYVVPGRFVPPIAAAYPMDPEVLSVEVPD